MKQQMAETSKDLQTTQGKESANDWRHLQSDSGCSPSQVWQALTVTQNKLGDLWYRAGNLVAAKDFYGRALTLRHRALQLTEGSEHLRAQLDLALSLLKVADVNQVPPVFVAQQ